ncbi:MAG: hypothetical protein IJ568_06330 [Bacilli bacterium]|nr:hypothetical protein [Bacilli bacterium]
MDEQSIINLGIVGIKNMGVYDPETEYEKLNVVTYQGSSYCAKQSTTGNLPTDTDYWQLYAEKGGTGPQGPQGPKPVKGVDYYTIQDKNEIESDLSNDIASKISSSLGSLVSATPLVASSTSEMIDTTRVYVNTTDGHWYWYDGEDWQDGGVYQATELDPDNPIIEGINSDINFIQKKICMINSDSLEWEQGGVSSSGELVESNIKIRTKLTKVVKGSKIKPNDGFQKSVTLYMPNGKFLNFYSMNRDEVVINKDCYIRICTGYIDDSAITPIFGPETVDASIYQYNINNYLKNAFKNVVIPFNKFDKGYIKLNNYNIGDTVSLDQVLGLNTFIHCIIKVKENDAIYVDKVTGGYNGNAYGILDDEMKLLEVAGTDVTLTNKLIIAPKNGYVIINAATTNNDQYVCKMDEYYSNEELENIIKSIKETTLLTENKLEDLTKGYINLSGNTTDFNVTVNDGWLHGIFDVEADDEITISGTGGSNARLYAFADDEGVIISKANADITGNYTIKAPSNCKFIVNIAANSSNKKVFIKTEKETVQKTYNELISKIEKVDEKIPVEFVLPLLKFNFYHNLKDVSSIISNFDMSTPALRKTIMEQVYSNMDTLLSTSNGYITKVDAAVECNLSYPEYANGVQVDGDYLATPAYKTYMYKLIDTSAAAGNTTYCKKKKLLIIGGVHGDEIAAPVNLYTLAYRLCNDYLNDDNLFKLRSAFDIYIIPCINGYGLYHSTRYNANGININKNYPISNWEQYGSIGDPDYSGDTPGSEFETKIVCGITNIINPQITIDHHNYGAELDWQFYTNLAKVEYLHIAYESLVDCSLTFKKDLPQYFGTLFGFVKNRLDAAPRSVSVATNATACNWWNEKGIQLSATVEISSSINYLNGVYNPNGSDLFGNYTFSVGEYTLMNMLLHYCQYILEHSEN